MADRRNRLQQRRACWSGRAWRAVHRAQSDVDFAMQDRFNTELYQRSRRVRRLSDYLKSREWRIAK